MNEGEPRRVQDLRAEGHSGFLRPNVCRWRPSRSKSAAFPRKLRSRPSRCSANTQSGERSDDITADRIADVGLRGRDFMGTLKVLPGVIDTSARDAPGWNSVGGMTINGRRSFNFSYDGITNKDTGSNRATTRRRRWTRSPKSRCRRRTSRPSTAARRARRSSSSPRAAARGSAGRPRTTSVMRRSTRTRGRGAAAATPMPKLVARRIAELREAALIATTTRPGRWAVRC